jgi:hypothetical protein
MLTTELKKARASADSPTTAECGERRRHLRYDKAGTLTFESRGRRYSGALVNVSKSGLLFLADTPPPIEALGTITLEMTGVDGALIGDARIVRRYPTGAAITFMAPPVDLEQCIPWLPHRRDSLFRAAV